MADNLAIPLLKPPHSKSFFSEQHLNPQSAVPPLLSPLLQDLRLHRKNTNRNSPETQHSQSANYPSPIPRQRRRIGKNNDPNRGKPWSHNRLSPQGQRILQTLIDPNFNLSRTDDTLLKLFNSQPHEESEFCFESLSSDILGVIKGLGFHRKCDLAMNVFNWVRTHKDSKLLLNGSVVAAITSVLGKEGRVYTAASLLLSMKKDGFAQVVYGYTSLIIACATTGRYREAVTVFKEMEEEGFKPTLVTCNAMLNVYGKLGMPWGKIMRVFEGMKSSGFAPNVYTYNTLIACCRHGSLYQEANDVFEEMKSAGIVPDRVTYNALLDVYGKSRRPKEAMEVLREMEDNGFWPTIITYNSLVAACARNGLLDEAIDLKNQMVEKGIKPDVFTYTTLMSGLEKAGKDESAMRVFEEMRSTGCNPNICTFNALMNMYGKRGEFTEMMKVFADIRGCGCSPDIISYNTVILAHCRNGQMREAFCILTGMIEFGPSPDVITYNTFVASYAAEAKFVEAIDVVLYMIQHGCKPDRSTYNSIVDSYCKLNRRDEATGFVNNLRTLDPHVSRDEESRLSERLSKQ